MSVESAKEFIQKGRANEQLRSAVTERLAGKTKESAIPAILEVAAAHGFTFSADDYKKAAQSVTSSLSPEELAKISGGHSGSVTVLGIGETSGFSVVLVGDW